MSFNVGDQVVCIHSGPWPGDGWVIVEHGTPTCKSIYTVTWIGIMFHDGKSSIYIGVKELPDFRWRADCFRLVRKTNISALRNLLVTDIVKA